MIGPIAKLSYEASLSLRRKILGSHLKDHVGRYPLKFLEFGRQDAPTLVFLHGFLDEKHNFFLAGRKLARHYRILVPDLPGFGQSARFKDETFTLNNYAIWLAEFLQQEAKDKVHLVGNSLGGAVTLRLALDFPQLLKSITLVNSAGVYVSNLPETTLYQKLANNQNPFWFEHHSEIEAFFNYVFSKRPFIPGPILRHLGQLFVENRHWHSKLLEDLLEGAGPDSSEEERIAKALNHHIHQIELPTFILWGAEDQLFPLEVGKAIKQSIGQSVFEIFPGLGHCPHAEGPNKFSDILHSHLKQL